MTAMTCAALSAVVSEVALELLTGEERAADLGVVPLRLLPLPPLCVNVVRGGRFEIAPACTKCTQ